MGRPNWSDVRESLTRAILVALPLQMRKAGGDRIVGIGLHIDAYSGSAGLYLLPESAARDLDPDAVDNIGDWPISTDWILDEDHARAFAAHWGPWDEWFSDHARERTESEADEKARGLLRAACEAMRDVEKAGRLDAVPKTEGFQVIIVEHDEPAEYGIERYRRFLESGEVRCHGDEDRPV